MNRIESDHAVSYDDVLLVPQYSTIESRKNIDIGSDLDAASRLWRETTGNDSDHHLSMMSEYQGRYSKVCDDAYHDALSVYSYDSSRRNMDAMI